MNELIDYNKWAIKKKILNRKIACDKTFNEELMSFIYSKVATDKDQHKRAAAHRINIVIKELDSRYSEDVQIALDLLGEAYQKVDGGYRIDTVPANIEQVREILSELGTDENWCDGYLAGALDCVNRLLMDDSEIKQEYIDAIK